MLYSNYFIEMNHLTNRFLIKLVTYSAIFLLTWTLQSILSLAVSRQQKEKSLFMELLDFLRDVWMKMLQHSLFVMQIH